jgi:hypothetical protein
LGPQNGTGSKKLLKIVNCQICQKIVLSQSEKVGGHRYPPGSTYYVCKLNKALYGPKRAPRAWYSRLDKYLQQAGFRKGSVDNNLYIKVSQGNILLIEVYVDDIIFGSDDDRLIHKFSKDMQNEFEMSLLGKLSFFLGLQIHQRNQGIFISQTKYIKEMLKRFRMEY